MMKNEDIEYAFEAEDGTLVLTTWAATAGFATGCFFVGKDGDLQEYNVVNFVRYRDGGTTVITAQKEGQTVTLYSPSPFKKDGIPTINGKPAKDVRAAWRFPQGPWRSLLDRIKAVAPKLKL
jgi:hypothetical protein